MPTSSSSASRAAALIELLRAEQDFQSAAAALLQGSVDLDVARYALLARTGEMLPVLGIKLDITLVRMTPMTDTLRLNGARLSSARAETGRVADRPDPRQPQPVPAGRAGGRAGQPVRAGDEPVLDDGVQPHRLPNNAMDSLVALTIGVGHRP